MDLMEACQIREPEFFTHKKEFGRLAIKATRKRERGRERMAIIEKHFERRRK